MNESATESVLHHVNEFGRMKGSLPGYELPWLASWRETALEHFFASGLPTQRDEDWKYTSIAPIERARFKLAIAPGEGVNAAEVEALALPGAHLLVFVDGHYVPALSRTQQLPSEVSVASVADLLARQPERIEAWLGGQEAYASAFAALNAACMTDGAFVEVPAGFILDAPIQLLFVTRSGELAIHSRNRLLAGADSRVTVIEHHVALGTPSGLNNVVTDIALGPGARLSHHKLQQESARGFHVAAIGAHLERGSHFVSGAFAFGGALARADIGASLDGIHAECVLDGLYLADGRQHIDHHTCIDHAKPGGTSRELYKGVLAGSGRAVFNGKVIVRPDAQRTDAAQTNRNLLLSAHAEIDTKPQLEIWADDVKCSHAATVGQLDADQIFYLRARGVDDAVARSLLTYAFAAEMVERVAEPALQARLDALLRARLPQPLETLR